MYISICISISISHSGISSVARRWGNTERRVPEINGTEAAQSRGSERRNVACHVLTLVDEDNAVAKPLRARRSAIIEDPASDTAASRTARPFLWPVLVALQITSGTQLGRK